MLVVTGVRPETSLAVSAGASLGARGAITVDKAMRTGLPDIYAAGDCVITHHRLLGETYLPLGTTAHKQGRVAGENAAGGRREFAGSLGTQVVKIFDQAAARTGLRDHEAAAGFDPVTVAWEADDHKAYYPGSHRIAMRFTGDRATGRLLGVQLFGHKHAEIAKRIDIAATAIFNGMTVEPGQRPGPVLHPATGQPLGRHPGRRPGLAAPGTVRSSRYGEDGNDATPAPRHPAPPPDAHSTGHGRRRHAHPGRRADRVHERCQHRQARGRRHQRGPAQRRRAPHSTRRSSTSPSPPTSKPTPASRSATPRWAAAPASPASPPGR